MLLRCGSPEPEAVEPVDIPTASQVRKIATDASSISGVASRNRNLVEPAVIPNAVKVGNNILL